ncbi:hypothetical protein D3C72_2548810 [compost metagenome]
MESGKYTLIPETLNDLSKEFTGVQATTEIDDNNVYVSLSDGKESKFIILPRQAEKLGVWNNA